jgi:ribosomal protein S13
MMENKTRVYALARSLGIDTDRVLVLCEKAGINAMNGLSSLDDAQCKRVTRLIERNGPDGGLPIPVPGSSPASPGLWSRFT